MESSSAAPQPPVLAVQDLRTYLYLRRGTVKAVDGVTLHLDQGEILGLVGESGCGKTMTGLSILRLVPKHGGRIVSGSIRLDGEELLSLSEAQMARAIRGRKVSMVSQDPQTSLNPVFSVGDQVMGPLKYHGLARTRRQARAAAIEALARVRIPSPELRLGEYPHQFSGGMRQRVVTAMALACLPRLLIADEPTSALDVTIQAQMAGLFRRLQQETGVAILLITHDLGVAAGLCQRIAVMYAGRIVETGPVREIFRHPVHPYTQALLQAVPRLGEKRRRLATIPGQPPSLASLPVGCRFAPRCPQRMPQCDQAYPPQTDAGPSHSVSCWLTHG